MMMMLFGLLLGLSIAELLTGLARSWRLRIGVTRTVHKAIRIGWLVPLLGLLVLADQTHFWIAAYQLQHFIAFNYATLLGVLLIIGGYYVLSTFVFPDDPSDWPDFDEYYLRTNRTVVGGMFAINLVTLVIAAWLRQTGFRLEETPIFVSWFSLGAAMLFLPGLIALWFVKSRRANLILLSR